MNIYQRLSDISFKVTYPELEFAAGEIAVALGGPNIYIVTNAYNSNVEVQGYWGSDRVSIIASDNLGIDDYLNTLYDEVKEY